MSTPMERLRHIAELESERLERQSIAGGLSEDDLKKLVIIARVARMSAKKEVKKADTPLTDEEVRAMAAKARQA